MSGAGGTITIDVPLTAVSLDPGVAPFSSKLYSVTASRVTQRRHEIAIRIALGATPPSVRRSILVHSVIITATGLTPGILLGLTATTFVAGILPGLEPATTSITASLSAALLALTLAATLSPARRAASTDPMRVLKD